MAYELDHLFDRPMVPCPHCGTRNEEGSETCLCCGKRLATMGNVVSSDASAEADRTPDTDGPENYSASVATETAVVPTAQPHDDNNDEDETVPRKRMPRWLIALIAIVNVLMICAVVLQVMYIKSPAHTVADYIEKQKVASAHKYYNENVKNNPFYRMVLTRRLKDFLKEQKTRYESGELNISTYVRKCHDMLSASQVTGLGNDFMQYVKAQFQQLLEETHAEYVRSITSATALDYDDTMNIFYKINDRNLYTDHDRVTELINDINLIHKEEALFSEAVDFEASGTPQYAIIPYASIVPDHPRSQSAAEGIDRCIADWSSNVRQYMTGPEVDVSTLNSHIGQIDHTLVALQTLNMLTDARKESLTTLQAEVLPRYTALVKQNALVSSEAANPNYVAVLNELQYALKYHPGDIELVTALKKIALRAHRAGTLDNESIVKMLNEALHYFPDDAELLEAAAPRKAQLKADLRKNLPDYLNSYDPLMISMEMTYNIMQLLPGDADLEALYRALGDAYHRLDANYENGTAQGFDWLFTFHSNYQITDNLLINPVADACGRLHQSVNLYRMTATADAPSVFSTGSPENYGTLRFSIFADPSCTGSGVIEIRTAHKLDANGQPVWSESVWTSPVLDRNTNGAQVELDLNRAIAVDIRLTAGNGTVVMLLDGAALKLAE